MHGGPPGHMHVTPGWGHSHADENSHERANNARALTCAETERIENSHVRENGVFAIQTREK